MAKKTAIGAGLQHIEIKTADGEVYDVYGAVSADGEPQNESVEVRGDDRVLGTFFFSASEEVSITANALSLDVFQAITGNAISSSASGSEVAFGTNSEQNPPYVQVSALSVAKDVETGNSVYIRKTWYKVQLSSPNISQAGEQEFSVELTGTAIQTDTDIEGEALDETSIGKVEIYS